MKLVLEPIFEADFHPCSYGYRPQRDAKMASKAAIRNDLYQGAWGVVEIDFRSYFYDHSARQADHLDQATCVVDGEHAAADQTESDGRNRS